ncbi:hydroxylysine kinase-like [Pecten maximus]|uniref:hydroxylysine kinase-like n=1 Tax=Pecten maximus TaxID=6579 RepID=UPI0014581DC9|nr:hydroxylysine kinase-like [Pecten maximus]
MTYIRGTVLADLSVTWDMLHKLGNLTGKLNLRMQSFPNTDNLNYDSMWKLSEIGQLLGLVHYAPSKKLQAISLDIITEFNSKVAPNMQTFQTGLIHHDMGPQNIVMTQNTDSTWKVAAVLDFGDVCTSCYVFEVAIMLSSIFMNQSSRSLKLSEMALTQDTLFESYTAVMPLSEIEESVLDVCVKSRVLQCSLIGEKTRETDPENKYIGNYICWDVLEKLESLARRDGNVKSRRE